MHYNDWIYDVANDWWPESTQKKDTAVEYQHRIIKRFGAEVWYEIAYGLPKLERETVESEGLP